MDHVTFAADTIIRFRSGRILIHTASSNMPAFETDHPMVIGWLCQFARPTSIAGAVEKLSLADRKQLDPILGYLLKSGALVQMDAARAAPDPNAVAALTQQHLKLLSRSLYDLSCDLAGLGSYAEAELHSRTGTGVERRLMALLSSVDALRSELAALRREHILRQLSALGLDAKSVKRTSELKLHIGCGKGLLEGWVNIDVSPAPLSLNVQWGLPFEDGSVRFVFVSHLLEHLFFPRDAKPFLAEIRRVLMPKGVVRIVVPDIEQCIAAYVANDSAFFGNRRETWPWWPENPTRLEDFLAYAGAGAEPAYLFESHKYGYDLETLTRVLTDAGFSEISRSEYMASAHPPLQVDHISAVAGARYGDKFYSLFVEARK